MCIEYVSSGLSASWKHIGETEFGILIHSLGLMNKEGRVAVTNTVYSSHFILQRLPGSSHLNSGITESRLCLWAPGQGRCVFLVKDAF